MADDRLDALVLGRLVQRHEIGQAGAQIGQELLGEQESVAPALSGPAQPQLEAGASQLGKENCLLFRHLPAQRLLVRPIAQKYHRGDRVLVLKRQRLRPVDRCSFQPAIHVLIIGGVGDTAITGPEVNPYGVYGAHVVALQVFRCSGVQVFRTGNVKGKPALVDPEHLNT